MATINTIRNKYGIFNAMPVYFRENSTADTVYQVATVAAVLLLLGSIVVL